MPVTGGGQKGLVVRGVFSHGLLIEVYYIVQVKGPGIDRPRGWPQQLCCNYEIIIKLTGTYAAEIHCRGPESSSDVLRDGECAARKSRRPRHLRLGSWYGTLSVDSQKEF